MFTFYVYLKTRGGRESYMLVEAINRSAALYQADNDAKNKRYGRRAVDAYRLMY